jgi:ABC-type uncharacterized transport system permease subunit
MVSHGTGFTAFAIVLLGGANPVLALNIACALFACSQLITFGRLHGHGIAFGGPVLQCAFLKVTVLKQ